MRITDDGIKLVKGFVFVDQYGHLLRIKDISRVDDIDAASQEVVHVNAKQLTPGQITYLFIPEIRTKEV